MILPNIDDRIAWYKETMRPDDPAIGVGISDWAITWEWRKDLRIDDRNVWGCMCSPISLPAINVLTPEDIAAKRAHLIFRTPETMTDLGEIERTLLHELGHVLLAPLKSPHVDDEENAMHSLDAVFAKLSPEQGRILARAIKDPKARPWAPGETMPEDKKAEEKPPEAEVKKQEAPRGVAEIEKAIAEAKLAGQPFDDLVNELVAALVARGAQPAAPNSEPPSVPPMGVTDQAAMARAIAEANTEAKKAIVGANPHLNDAQKAIVLEQPTAAKARAIAESYPKPTAAPEPPKMGAPHPALGGGAKTSVLARAIAEKKSDRVFCRALGIGSSESDGISHDVGGYIVYVDGTERLMHLREKYNRRREGATQ